MQSFEFTAVARIINGVGSALELAAQCRRLGIEHPLLVTDPGLMSIGLIQPVLAALEKEGLAPLVFDQVREDPPEATVLAAAEVARPSPRPGPRAGLCSHAADLATCRLCEQRRAGAVRAEGLRA